MKPLPWEQQFKRESWGGEVKDSLLLDVTPLSLGLETLGEVTTKVIERNTTLPTSHSQTFSTAVDGQTSVEIHVLQGERAMAKDNKSLGKFLFTGIPPAPRGVPQIEVSFDIDANGILKVSAIDRGTGKQQSIQITNTGGLSEAEIERMRQEAELYADEDEQRQQIAALKNQSESLFYNCKVTLKQNAQLITNELKQQIRHSATALKKAVANPNISYEEMKEQVEAFQAVLYQIGTAVYEKAGQAPSESEPAAPEPSVNSEDQEIAEAETLLTREEPPVSLDDQNIAEAETLLTREASPVGSEDEEMAEAETLLEEPSFMAMEGLDTNNDWDAEAEEDSEIDPGNPFIISSNS
jgi:molecular chaperone DnaK